ncbi:hypothetical protein DL96DRAFT_1667396 [Flagelloscypha sp. PMI_526]|nr:hypothetical protein DL96DRAFT_1667396 [Flagelloscypha sp. PMI_526]
MAQLLKSLGHIWPRTPLSATASHGGVGLPMGTDEPLLANAGKELDLKDISQKCELRIEGMTCGACVEAIEGMLRPQPGIQSVKVALLAERGVVEYDPHTWDPEKIIEEISDIGFDATLIPSGSVDRVTFRVYGMTCSACTSTVSTSVAVALTTETCTVDYDHSIINPREMIERIEDMGFDAILSDNDDSTQIQSLTKAKEIAEWRRRLFWASVFAAPVFFISMICPMISFMKPILEFCIVPGLQLGDFLAFALATPSQFWLGMKFHKNAYKSLRHGASTMDVLVSMGTSSAYIYSFCIVIYAIIVCDPEYHPVVFFETSAMLVWFVSLGRYLENSAKGQTSAALTDLMALAPSMATIYTDAPACTQEKKIATELIEVGDHVKLVPGDKIPADGTVTRGSSTVDESALTGEPIPILKQAGDSVMGGTINGLGTFDMVVTRAGKDTALKQIVKLVEDAQTSKAPIQEFADKAAGYFVPTILALALVTLLSWAVIAWFCPDGDLPMMFHRHGASKFSVVIVVACPCALGLSTPTAIMNGILIKGGRALEASRHIKRIVLDKTGTVTVGKLTLYGGESNLDGLCADNTTSKKIAIAMVSATEARSEHPLAKAIATYGKDLLQSESSIPEATIETFESVTGAGVKALVSCGTQKVHVLVGNARFVTQSDDGHLPSTLSSFETRETSLARTIIYVSLQKGTGAPLPILAVALSDAPKPSSKHAIAALRKMGIEVNMMTGDGKATALAVAKQVGIRAENVYSQMSPKGKASKVTEFMETKQGGVAMVGDGINDSPALVAATVGIALSSGTSVAVEAADIVLVRSDLLDVVAALHLSRKIFSVIKRNLIWACIYNILGVPLAMGVFIPFGLYMPPMLAGGAMAFSSVSVVLSSLTLKWWTRPTDSIMPSGDRPSSPGWLEPFAESFRNVASDLAGGVRGLVAPRNREGYSQLPVDMGPDSRV